MGMAASQARLLTLTARIHDVEFEAQSIQNAKVQLATQEDSVYREYQEALDATTLTFTKIDPTSAEQSTVVATYNNLFSTNRALPANGNMYVLLDSKGRLVVDSELLEGYEDFKDSEFDPENAYAFAMYMILGDDFEEDVAEPLNFNPSYLEYQENILDDITSPSYRPYIGYYYTDSSGNKLERIDYQSGYAKFDSMVKQLLDILSTEDGKADHIYDTQYIKDDDELMAKYEELLNQYHEYAFNIYAANMYEESTGEDAEKFNMNEFNYYVRMYEMLEQCGGMGVAIEDFDGPYGDARNDAEWLTNMVQCGQMSIMTVNYDKKTKEITLKGCSVGADTDLKYTTTTEIDKVALAKAEAKYEHDLKLIDKKDKQLDLSLSKLETERNALKTEYDSVKKVIQDNIDRTFGIFS